MQVQPITYQILESYLIESRVEAGEIIVARVDKVLLNDVTAPLARKILEEANVEPVAETYVFLDHYSPPPNIDTARIHARLRMAAKKYGFKLYDIGHGICTKLLSKKLSSLAS